MIGVVTKGVRFSSFVSEISKKHSRKSLFCHNNNTRAISSRGYVLTYFYKHSIDNKIKNKEIISINKFFYDTQRQLSTEQDLQTLHFEKISNETLESLSEYFDELIEEAAHLPDADVSSGDGVLTIKFGNEYGTYVINRQVPNQQIWLSSPKSGPKRYDFIDGTWIYKHDGKSLHELLNEEIPDIVKFPVSFDKCSYSSRNK